MVHTMMVVGEVYLVEVAIPILVTLGQATTVPVEMYIVKELVIIEDAPVVVVMNNLIPKQRK